MERRTFRNVFERTLRLLFVGAFFLLPILGIAFYFLFVESLQLHLDSDRIVLQYELVGEERLNSLRIRNGAIVTGGGPLPREITVPISWILYSISGLIACGIVLVLFRRRKKLNADADSETNEGKPARWRPRLQFSLRTFLIAAMLLGVIIPATIYRARTVLDRQRLLRMGYIETSHELTNSQLASAMRHTEMTSMWQALTYRPAPRWGKPRHVKITAAMSGAQDYRIININPQVDREQLVLVEVKVGQGKSGCSLDLFAEDVDLKCSSDEQNRIRLEKGLLNIYDLDRKTRGLMLFPIKPGESYQLGVTGNWMSAPNSKNEVEITIRVDDF